MGPPRFRCATPNVSNEHVISAKIAQVLVAAMHQLTPQQALSLLRSGNSCIHEALRVRHT